jgi:hypothetical protein
LIAGILLPGVPFAIETAPRLSDREIIESLAEIKAEFKVIHERFEAVEQRMDAEFKRMDQRFERMDRRMAEGFSEQMNVTLMLFGSLIMLITALFAYNRVGPPHGGQAPRAETRCGRGKDHQARTGLAARPRPRQPGRPKLTRLIQVLAGRDQPLAADLKHAALLLLAAIGLRLSIPATDCADEHGSFCSASIICPLLPNLLITWHTL